MIALFERFPRLHDVLPYAPLATLPTPLQDCSALLEGSGATSLYVKCDGISGTAYGGNKVRKLAFLLAAARARGAESTITFGAAGSNHALATAIYARQLGLQPISMMVSQCNARVVRKNLLRGHAAGAALLHFDRRRDIAKRTAALVMEARREGKPRPYIIPAGGSSPLGTLGFVDGALEFAAQLKAGEAPVPDEIYVASGTMGTCVGLLIGLQIAGLPTRVMAVRVTLPPFSSMARARILYARTVRLLKRLDDSVPDLCFPEGQFVLREGFVGEKYARFTNAGMAAVTRAHEACGVRLEGTYTGKAMACLLDDGNKGLQGGKHIAFWNTYNAIPQGDQIKSLDYHQLPAPFHRYFEKAVQELDRLEE